MRPASSITPSKYEASRTEGETGTERVAELQIYSNAFDHFITCSRNHYKVSSSTFMLPTQPIDIISDATVQLSPKFHAQVVFYVS
jgi:hypothetical protein